MKKQTALVSIMNASAVSDVVTPKLTIEMLLLWADHFFGRRFTNGLGEALPREAVLRGCKPVREGLSRHGVRRARVEDAATGCSTTRGFPQEKVPPSRDFLARIVLSPDTQKGEELEIKSSINSSMNYKTIVRNLRVRLHVGFRV
jgi:hypothetical protein